MAGNVLIKNANGNTVTLQNPDTNLGDVTVDTSKIAQISNVVGFKNYIINGNFDIWQYKDAGLTYPQASSGYGSDDRWNNANVGSTKTHSQVACTDTERALFNASYFSRTAVTSVVASGNHVRKEQAIENVTKLAGKTVTLSFWAKADAAKNIAIELVQTFGTGGSPSAYVYGIGAQNIALTTTWQKKTITISIPSIVGKTLGTDGIHTSATWLRFWFDANSSYSVSTTLGQQSGTFDIAQVQLEEGSVATPFENRPYGLELSLCQRYYEVGLPQANGAGILRFCGNVTNTIGYTATIAFKTVKRTSPTVVLTNVYTSGFASTSTVVNSSIYGIAEDRAATGTNSSATFISSFTASAEL